MAQKLTFTGSWAKSAGHWPCVRGKNSVDAEEKKKGTSSEERCPFWGGNVSLNATRGDQARPR